MPHYTGPAVVYQGPASGLPASLPAGMVGALAEVTGLPGGLLPVRLYWSGTLWLPYNGVQVLYAKSFGAKATPGCQITGVSSASFVLPGGAPQVPPIVSAGQVLWVEPHIIRTAGTTTSLTAQICLGPLGTTSDPIIYQLGYASGISGWESMPCIKVAVNSSTSLTTTNWANRGSNTVSGGASADRTTGVNMAVPNYLTLSLSGLSPDGVYQLHSLVVRWEGRS